MSVSDFVNHLRIATPKTVEAMNKRMNWKESHQIHKCSLWRERGDGTKKVTTGISTLPVMLHF